MEVFAVIEEMLTLFIIMAIGYIANKVSFITKEGNRLLSKLIVNITLPAMVLASVMSIGEKMAGWDLLLLLAVAFASYAILGLLAFLTPRILRAPREKAGVYSFLAMFGNVGFVGFPIITAVYGKEAVFYAALFNIPFNLLIFSVGVAMLSAGEKFRLSRQVLLNPSLLASILALILYILPLKFPGPIVETVDLLGSITVPGAMLVVGASLGSVPVKEVFNDARVYAVSLVKLLLCPVLIWLCFHQVIDNPLILGAAVITTAMPSATNAAMLTMEYGGDEALASKGIFIATILSIVTIPLVITLL